MSDLKNKEFLFSMLKIASPSGYEFEVQKYIIDQMKDIDEKIYTHHNYNVVHAINTDSKMKVLLAGHIDEIGLVIEDINSDGTCRVTNTGGIRPYVYLGQHVNVYSKDLDGNITVVPGVFGYLPNMGSREIKASDLILDLGVSSKEEAEKLVKIGDCVVHSSDYVELAGGKLAGRALDDKLGAFICLEAMRRVKERNGKNGVYVATTVGEETTGRGAIAASQMIDPTCAIIVDVTYASDVRYRENLNNPVALGKGPALTRGSLINQKMEQLVLKTAKKLNMNVQFEIASSRTFTDLDSIFSRHNGIPCYLISIPLRYMHSSVEVCEYKDVEDIIELIATFIMDLDENTNFNPFEE